MIKKFGVYLLGNFGSKLLSFVMVPLYTSLLLPSEFGLYDYWGTIVGLISSLVGMELFRTIYTKLLQYKNDEKQKNTYLAIAVQFLVVQIIISGLIGLILAIIIPEYAIFISMIIALSMLTTFFSSLSRGFEKNSFMAISGVIQTFFTLSTTIGLLYLTNIENRVAILFLGQIMGMIAANSYYFIMLVIKEKLFTKITMKFYSKTKYVSILKFSLPLVPSTISWWIMNVSDRFLIVNYLGEGANGLYAMAYKFPSLLMMINSIVAMVWQDEAILTHNNANKGQYYSKQLKRYMIIQYLALALFTVAFKVGAPILLKNEFIEAINYVPLLGLSVVFSGLASFYGTFYLSTGRTKGAFATSVYGAITNIVVNFIFIQFFGLYAAAISTVLSFAVMAVIRVFEFKKEIGIKFPIKENIIGLIVFSVLYIFMYL